MSLPKATEQTSKDVEEQSHSVTSPPETSATPATSEVTVEQPSPSSTPQQQQQQQGEEEVNSQPEPSDKTTVDKDQDEEEDHLTLPIAKIKRIFKLDPDYAGASASAVYTAGLATELFVQYFAEQASLLAKMDKRKKIQYKDFSNAVAAHDALNFLSDTIPKTQPIGELVQQKKVHVKQSAFKSTKPSSNTTDDVAHAAASGSSIRAKDVLPKGQQTLNFPTVNSSLVKKPEGTQKKSILDLVTVDDETDSDKDTVMTD